MATKEEVREALKNSIGVEYHVWCWYGTEMSCCEKGCCKNTNNSIEEALEQIEYFCDGDWDDVKIMEVK